jgi:hypothetical protein
MTLMPDAAFHWVLSALVGGVAAGWAIHDLVLIARLRGADRRDPKVRDQRFGYAIGILIGMIGIVGTLRFNGVL